jgi:UDP-N-acetylmuramyl pentapeptide phosphotransferase/UDP-N-acetylglucosamine-1-phosphate transferase
VSDLTIVTGAGMVAAALVSYLGVGAVRRWAARHGVVDRPNERSSHLRVTPRGGGLAIVGVTVAGSVIAWRFAPAATSAEVAGPLLGATLVAAVSWLDDLHSLPTTIRLLAHGTAAIAAVASIGPWRVLAVPPFGAVDLGWAGWPLTVLWIVGLTNAYNFMDGIDGLAAGQAIVAGLGWVLLGALGGQPLIALCGALLAAASAGFLAHNWPPARIFMGDVGSAFLGYAFATLAVLGARLQPLEALAGALLVWPFLFDATFTFGLRLARGEDVFAAHRSHLYQRLVITGLSHGTVSALYAALALLGVVLAVGLHWQPAVAAARWWPLVIAGAALGLWTLTVSRERRGGTR